MKKTLGLALGVALFGCVTINIYFPAEEVKTAADEIVREVWQAEPGSPTEVGPQSSIFDLFTPAVAQAEQDINVSTAQIKTIKNSMKSRVPQLKQYLDSGVLGIGKDGLLKIVDAGKLGLKDRAAVNGIMAAENADRENLYKEIAKANGFPDKVGEVKSIFAGSWKAEAQKGWKIEQADGRWSARQLSGTSAAAIAECLNYRKYLCPGLGRIGANLWPIKGP